MKNIIAISVLSMLAMQCHAGVKSALVAGATAGVVAGVVANSSKPSAQPSAQGSTVFRGNHDTILCRSDDGFSCDGYYVNKNGKKFSPAGWAALAGYKVIWKSYPTIISDDIYLVIEVSK